MELWRDLKDTHHFWYSHKSGVSCLKGSCLEDVTPQTSKMFARVPCADVGHSKKPLREQLYADERSTSLVEVEEPVPNYFACIPLHDEATYHIEGDNCASEEITNFAHT